MSAASQHFSTLSTLSPVQTQVAAALAEGHTVTAAAAAAGLHRTTIYHWLKTQPPFATAVQEARGEYVARLRDDLRALSAKALARLHQLLDDPSTPASVQLRAALAILQRPAFPSPGWNLPAPVGTPDQERIADQLALIEADCRHMRLVEALEKAAPSEGDPTSAVPQS